jgi:tellurite resistance protein TerC
LLKYALGVILVFVGLKMAWLNNAYGGKFPIAWSLGIVAGILAFCLLLSVAYPQRKVIGSSSS